MPETQENFAQLHEIYRQNISPAMVKYLAEDLGVSAESLERLGVGYNYAKSAFTFPERDHNGEVIGLSLRFTNGKKGTESGSKRGLTYIVNPDYRQGDKKYEAGNARWFRLEAGGGYNCPVCGHDNWCMVSSIDVKNPPAVNCCRKSVGSVSTLGMGWLHILRPDGDLRGSGLTVLPKSGLPVLVVEGLSDVAAAYDLGFVAIGRPAANGGLLLLKNMPLHGREIVIVGENDNGVGAAGMEATFRVLRKVSQNTRKILPPSGIKDLRAWKKSGVTQDSFMGYVKSGAETLLKDEIFEDDTGATIAKHWMEAELMSGGYPVIRNYQGEWVKFNGTHYQYYPDEQLRGDLYSFLEGKFYQQEDKNGAVTIKPYKSSRSKLNDVLDAMNQWCPISSPAPSWLDNGVHPDPKDVIVFRNGMLDVKEYIKGRIKLTPITPAYFTFNTLPYDFSEASTSVLWTEFLSGVFPDPVQIALLSEWMGYLLVPDITYEKLMLFTGQPRSGKSTVLETIRAMLGPEQCTETSFQSLVGSFGFHPLVGKTAALIGDAKTPRKHESDSALEKILQITGGDPVTVNRKGIKQLSSVQLYCRFTFAMNELPTFTDFSRALEARLNILSFERSFLGIEDRTLKHRLRQEAVSGKLTMFALEGLKRLRKNGQFTVPASSVNMMEQYKDLSIPTFSFVNECLDIETDQTKWTSGMWIGKDDMYDLWTSWCRIRGQRFGTKDQFFRWMKASFPQLSEQRRRLSTDRTYGFGGVSVKSWAMTKYMGRP
jgi:P4 family phage/plasmid primase-like protien